jgi:D-beta-D-heptose 7-phosphate kinase / D-beta-D-heptose 1-phosphate adenosyltransferase
VSAEAGRASVSAPRRPIPAELLNRFEAVRRAGGRIVFTNGCFDVLHAGHVKLLKEARAAGDFLLVAVNSDDSVRRLKGEGRPRNSEADRVAVLEAIRYVDAVVVFDEETPLEIILTLRPDVLVKGADYGPGRIVGEEEILRWGGTVHRIALLAGRSTTALLGK